MNRRLIHGTCGVILALSISGCGDRRGEECRKEEKAFRAALLAKLDSIEKELKKNPRQSLPVAPNSLRPQGANAEALRTIKPLPEKPTEQEVRRYLQDILKNSVNQRTFSSTDPQVAMLQKIGPGHLKTILNVSSSHPHMNLFYIQQALPALVNEQDKAAILELLPRYPILIRSVAQFGWLKEAKPAIVAALQSNDNIWELLPYISMLDLNAKDRENIVQTYRIHPQGAGLYQCISLFPDVNMEKIANEAWEKRYASSGGNSWMLLPYALNAAKHGNLEALEYYINARSTGTPRNNQDDIEFMRLTGESIATAPKWFRQNQNDLRFNRKKGRYEVVRPSPPATQK